MLVHQKECTVHVHMLACIPHFFKIRGKLWHSDNAMQFPHYIVTIFGLAGHLDQLWIYPFFDVWPKIFFVREGHGPGASLEGRETYAPSKACLAQLPPIPRLRDNFELRNSSKQGGRSVTSRCVTLLPGA